MLGEAARARPAGPEAKILSRVRPSVFGAITRNRRKMEWGIGIHNEGAKPRSGGLTREGTVSTDL